MRTDLHWLALEAWAGQISGVKLKVRPLTEPGMAVALTV